jgi:hypothetical protein
MIITSLQVEKNEAFGGRSSKSGSDEHAGASFKSILAEAGVGGLIGAGVGVLDPSLGIGTLAVIGGVAGDRPPTPARASPAIAPTAEQ